MALQRRLDRADASDNKADAYCALLTELWNDGHEENLKSFVDHLVKQNHVTMKPVYKNLGDLVKEKRKATAGAPYVPALEAMIATMSGVSHVILEEATNALRYNLAKIYQVEILDDDENFVKAARHLGKMSLDNAPAIQKVKSWVRCAQLYVADQLFREAEMFIQKVGQVIKFAKGQKIDAKYTRRYMSANASIQDFQGKFHSAANEYYKLSTIMPDPSEALEKLTAGLKCVLLAPGSSLLSNYYKDERSPNIVGFNLVEKMFLQRFIEKKDCVEFEKTLGEHQNQTGREGWTILEKAVIEHNLIAASNVYTNISLSNLGLVLGVETEKAEAISSKMITDGRLKGTIDQNKGTLQFLPHGYSELSAWDTHVGIACSSVNTIFDQLTALYPEWVEKQFA